MFKDFIKQIETMPIEELKELLERYDIEFEPNPDFEGDKEKISVIEMITKYNNKSRYQLCGEGKSRFGLYMLRDKLESFKNMTEEELKEYEEKIGFDLLKYVDNEFTDKDWDKYFKIVTPEER